MGRKKKEPAKQKPRAYIKPCLGFRFTEDEEYLMWLHTLSAKRFMDKYGQGVMPLKDGYPISRKRALTT